MPAKSVAQANYFRFLEHSKNAPQTGMTRQQLHDFASTPNAGLPERLADGGTTGKWMQGAVKRPGAETAKAHAAGQSPMQFARSHYHDSGLTGEQARFAVNANKGRRKYYGQ